MSGSNENQQAPEHRSHFIKIIGKAPYLVFSKTSSENGTSITAPFRGRPCVPVFCPALTAGKLKRKGLSYF